MKKILTILLLAVLALSICACGGTDTAADQEQAAEPAEIVVVDNENLTFKITGEDTDGFWGYTLNVFIENKTDKNLMLGWENTVVNGYACDPFWATDVPAGAKANKEISFSEESFEENGIALDEAKTIDFTLYAYDDDDWASDRIIEENFSFSTDELSK